MAVSSSARAVAQLCGGSRGSSTAPLSPLEPPAPATRGAQLKQMSEVAGRQNHRSLVPKELAIAEDHDKAQSRRNIVIMG